ncbi:MAG: undecaprenyldiphospho-muramoylpentapeptide beta-N-acetylglucosaminyltransferase [Oscillospiraceae bacterium]|nr:undecaprenyldiphospho-muramoylpentapeptide beta-N-acetylglucosaminyltransferase [Oscillospiraceae bacterium]MDD4414650.1 undecaprenyldiphospho-muramoylpentapeptide beta-N-acetylglucosaminyltransferase [Oscillospiraceae bacterium]
MDIIMRVLMTGGGTAGHINPALSIADKIRKENTNAEILFVGAKGRMETQLVPAAGYKIETVNVSGFQRRLSVKNIGRNISAAFRALTAGAECSRILKKFRPDIAIGTGGYVSGPILRKAAQMGIPVLVHESNAYPGVTVRMLSKYADAVLIAETASRKYLPVSARILVTGNPIGEEFIQYDRETARKELGLDERPMVLSFGGSLGAEQINRVMSEVLIKSANLGRLQHIHATGKKGFEDMQSRLAENIKKDTPGIRVLEYINDMARCMAAADLVISRCGAMTLSELPAAGRPSILIPSPNVAENHQYHNAMALVNKGAAVCIEEKDLTADRLWSEIERITSSPDDMRKMGENARSAAIYDAADRIYAVVIQTLKDRKK